MDQEQIDRIETVRAKGDVRHAGDDDDGGMSYTSADIARAIGMGPEERYEFWDPMYRCPACKLQTAIAQIKFCWMCGREVLAGESHHDYTGHDFLKDDAACMTHLYPWLYLRGVRVEHVFATDRFVMWQHHRGMAAVIASGETFAAACCEAVMRLKEAE